MGPKFDKVVNMGIMHFNKDSNTMNKNNFHFMVGASVNNPIAGNIKTISRFVFIDLKAALSFL